MSLRSSVEVAGFTKYSKRDLDVSVNKYVGFISERIFAHTITQIARKRQAAKVIEIIDSQKYIKMFN